MKNFKIFLFCLLSILVSAQNSPPVVENLTINTEENKPVSITLKGADPDGDQISYIIESLPTNGDLKYLGNIILISDLPKVLNSPNLEYFPNSNFQGSDEFKYKANSCSVTSPNNTSILNVTGDFNVSASKSYPMIIPPQKIQGSGSGTQVFRKNVDIKLTVAPENLFESCEVKLDIITFDDGLQFDIDGVNLLNFQQKHWDSNQGANTTEFNGNGRFVTAGGMWTPWSGQGSPKLEITNGTIKLMIDTRNGTREDALPFMDSSVSDWKLVSSFSYDCVSGFNLLIGNQNGGGGPSGINANLTIEAYIGPCDDSNIGTVSINVDKGTFSLPDGNNKISVGSCTCNGKNDGFLTFSIEKNLYDYSITVSGQDQPIKINGTNKSATLSGLGKGTYNICFKIDGQPNYEQCFEAIIAEPKSL